jgi:hypothetical protein
VITHFFLTFASDGVSKQNPLAVVGTGPGPLVPFNDELVHATILPHFQLGHIDRFTLLELSFSRLPFFLFVYRFGCDFGHLGMQAFSSAQPGQGGWCPSWQWEVQQRLRFWAWQRRSCIL